VLEFYLIFNTLAIRTERKCENQRANFGLILEPKPFHFVLISHNVGFRGHFQVGPRYLNLEHQGPIQQFKYPPNVDHDRVLFWFSLQGGCEGSKVVIFSSFTWVSHMERTLEAIFCFGLVCKVVVKVQKELYSFQLHELAMWTKH
jgi:hypothetical protein